MGVFFNPLFKKMADENVSQVTLQDECHISSLTFAQMRRGEYVPLESIVKLCQYFECDFEEIMTTLPPKADPLDPLQFTKNIKSIVKVYRAALKDYMQEAGLRISEVSQLTGLSVNTIKQILDGSSTVSSNSCWKLNVLGDRYSEIFDKYAHMFKNGIEIAHEEQYDYEGRAFSKIARHYLDEEIAIAIKDAIIDMMSRKKCSKKQMAENIGISINTLNCVLNGDIKSRTTVERIVCHFSDVTQKRIADLVDDEAPEVKREIFRSYACKNCRAFDRQNNGCYLEYDNIMDANGKYHSAEPCTHPRTFSMLFEEADNRNIKIVTQEKRLWELKQMQSDHN